MSNQVLNVELTAISQEAKRKHADIRTAAEKSLSELKSLASTSDQQLAADLSRRPQFIDPLILAATSKNARLANSALVCLQRLVVIRGLPRSRLSDVLDGFSASTSLSLDIQLKILQALPALAQNYAEDLNDKLLASALHVCAVLQNVKVHTVSAVAAATLQQLIVLVFDKVAAEDAASNRTSIPAIAEVKSAKGSIKVRQAAYDAVRVLQDLSHACEGQKLAFLNISALSPSLALELLHAALNAHGPTFSAHPEFVKPLQDHVAPAVIRLLSDRQGFAITLRALRIVPLLIQRHVPLMSEECEIILGLLTHLLDPDSAVAWKRVMVMEAYKAIYATPNLVIQLYMQYDQQERSKAIVRDNISSFVRLSTEKPALIGLGQQSTMPTKPRDDEDGAADRQSIDASNDTTKTATGSGIPESTAPGVSTQWSTPRVQLLDLLDKTDAPAIPETYVYSLTLECLNSLSDSLAKIILPLTMSSSPKKTSRRRLVAENDAEDSAATDDDTNNATAQPSRGPRSSRSSNVPVNPLLMANLPSAPRVRAIAGLLEDCWPALLATSSTFLYSALDNEYYRGLIRSVQRFTQVAGLLDLAVARDAFLTTLGKAAAPPNLSSSSITSVPSTPSLSSPTSFLTSKNLLNITTITQNVTATMQGRRPSAEPASNSLTTRNLLCLRALINLAIALGPTLKDSIAIIFGTLQQVDLYLDTIMQNNAGNTLAPLRNEIEAVSAASNRMMESTSDYPMEAFSHLVDVFCTSIDEDSFAASAMQSPTQSRRTSMSDQHVHTSSIAAISTESPLRPQDRFILIAKFGRLAELNTSRFAAYKPAESSWQKVAECLISSSVNSLLPKASRLLAADILCRCSVKLIALADNIDDANTPNVQRLALSTVHHLMDELQAQTVRLNAVDVQVLCRATEAIKTVVEAHGESLVTGWDVILKSISMSFARHDHEDTSKQTNGNSADHSSVLDMRGSPQMVSLDVGRISFSIMQSICSDFLSQLKSDYLISVPDLLHQFSRQTLDLNMSLTAITLFSDVSNFLLKDNAKEALEMLASPRADQKPAMVFDDLRKQGYDSRAAQWMINLHHLSEVAVDDRNEIRNGAFQMLLRILVDQSLDPHAFQFALTGVLLKLLGNDLEKQKSVQRQESKPKTIIEALDEASKSLIDGIAQYLNQNSTSFERTSQFQSTWRKWMTLIKEYIALKSHVINQAVYSAMATTLEPVAVSSERWQPAIALAMSLFNSEESIPVSTTNEGDSSQEQDAFLAYIRCAQEILRLSSASISRDQILAVADHVARCVDGSTRSKFSNDNSSMTQVQVAALDLLKSLRTDIPAWPQGLIRIGSRLVRLPGDLVQNSQGTRSPPRFVAFSKAAMIWLAELVKRYSQLDEVLSDGAITGALRAFALHIQVKYNWPKVGKPPPLWKKATICALEVIPMIVPMITDDSPANVDIATKHEVWQATVEIASAMVQGDYSPLEIPASFSDIQQVEEDEQFDAASLLALRSTMMPGLLSSDQSLSNHVAYCHALFSASIVHPLRPNQRHLLVPGSAPLQALSQPRHPTFEPCEPSRREDMAYLCLAELISMSSAAPCSFPWHPTSTFAEPYHPGEYGAPSSDHKRRLARAAAPYMVARFALPLKAYIADQPLRGRSPTPISMVEELVWTLERMRDVRLEVGALDGAEVGAKKGEGALGHVRALHALLIQAVGVAGSPAHGNAAILDALMAVLSVAG